MSICFAEFQNPTWNCRGICPLDGRARCITGVSSWKPGSFAFFTLLHDEPPPLSFRSHRMKSLGRNSSSNTFHIFLPTHYPSPFYFSWNNLFTNADIKFVTLCNFYGEFVLVSTNSHLSVLFKFRNLLSFVFFSFVFFFFSLWFLWNFNICYDNICNIFLYFEFSNLEEKIVKWFASNNIISTK